MVPLLPLEKANHFKTKGHFIASRRDVEGAIPYRFVILFRIFVGVGGLASLVSPAGSCLPLALYFVLIDV